MHHLNGKMLTAIAIFCVMLAASVYLSTTILLLNSCNVTKTKRDRSEASIPCLENDLIYRFIFHHYRRASGPLSTHRSHLRSMYTVETAQRKRQIWRLLQNSQIVKVEEVDCLAALTDSTRGRPPDTAIIGTPLCDQVYMDLTSDCTAFHKHRGYTMFPLTSEEEEFPVAFSLLVYKDAEMVERLLRAVYRPQNYYCIHVDQNSSDIFFRAIMDIANCFNNVFVATKRLNVQWSEDRFSVMDTELLCIRELWRFPKWKYLITLTGQDFPLRTNLELVRTLKAHKKATDASVDMSKYVNIVVCYYYF